LKFITWGEKLGKPECPYLRRWVLNFKLFSIRLHRWYYGDDERNFHDHSWWFLLIVLAGGYTDVSPSGEDRLSAGNIRLRHAEYRHTVRVDNKQGAWTFLITGPLVRKWGFWVDGKYVKSNKYFFEFGQHPCREVQIDLATKTVR
jgi:hypothetical protein